MQQQKRHFSGLNFLLLAVTAAASLGSLVPDTRSGNARATVDWEGEPATFTLTINPVEGLVRDFDSSRNHYMRIIFGETEAADVDTSRWTLEVVGNDSFLLAGTFELHDAYTEEFDSTETAYPEPREFGELEVDAGMFCGGEPEQEECIPCDLETGCTITISVDRCREITPDPVKFVVEVFPEEGEYTVQCHEDDDQTPCDLLGSWLEMTSTPANTQLCEEVQASEE